MRRPLTHRTGFTLIELSIVLVIIGLIVGGVLVGQDLIRAAGVRATISQIERYNTAVNTFRGKYGYLPGDIKDPDASNFGFAARGQSAGEGDGNGIIEGISSNSPGNNGGLAASAGETPMVWVDLSAAQLIDGTFNTASPSTLPSSNITGTTIAAYLPPAKLGKGNYIYVYSGLSCNPACSGSNGTNYFGLSAVSSIAIGSSVASTPSLSVEEAYSIDKKTDDGLPQTGAILAQYVNGGFGWAAGGGNSGAYVGNPAPSSVTTCYDNGNNAANPMQYSVEVNNGAGVNCALSFQFQ